ncbi:hypothetical protein EBI_26352 [Enterocytozoon bieneusi H348]|nr:hypothetical protein EBI_26352 [Enterocytozoon bieneusi H348]|eukprot:XP_002651122.1 hypothetical protein EBI_26352 [Enterocytozoon bieneusi H348]
MRKFILGFLKKKKWVEKINRIKVFFFYILIFKNLWGVLIFKKIF